MAHTDRLVSGLLAVCDAVTHACLYLLLLFPGVVSLVYLVRDTSLSGPDYLDAGAGQPLSIFLLHMLSGLAVAAWLMRRRRVSATTRSAIFLSVALLGAVVVSSARSSVPGEAWPATLSLAYGLAVYWLVVERMPSGRLQGLVPPLLALSGGASGWVGMALSAIVRPDVLTGAFFQPNVMAGYLLMTLPVTLGLWTTRRSATWFLCAVGEGGALLLTMSRGGLLAGGLIVLGFAMVCAWARVSRAVWAGLAGWSALCWLLFACLGSYAGGDGTFHWIPKLAVERAENTRHEDVASVTARQAFYRAALAIWREHPAWGVGMNGFNRYYPQHQSDFRWYSKYSHSMYLDWLAETGIVASVCFLGMVLWTGWRLARTLRRSSEGLVTAGLGLGMAGTLLHAAVDVDWKFAVIPLTFWIMAATLGGDEPSGEDAVVLDGPGGLQLTAALATLVFFVLSCRVWTAAHQQLMGNWYVEHDRPQEALVCLESSCAANPVDSDAYESLVDLRLAQYDQKGQPQWLDDAARAAEHAVRVDPHRAVEWSRLGQVKAAQGQWDDAEAAERKALALDPVNFPDFYNRLAILLVSRGRDTEAVALWGQAEQQFPWHLIASIQSFRQDALRPQIMRTYLQLGAWYYSHNEAVDAVQQYRQALAIDAENPDAVLGMATGLYAQKKPVEALPFLLKAEQQTPQLALVHLLLGSCYSAQQQWADSTRELKEAERLDPRLKSQIDAALHPVRDGRREK